MSNIKIQKECKMSKEETEKSIMLDPAEYENFLKYQKSLLIEEKRREIRKAENKISSSRNIISKLKEEDIKLKEELRVLRK